MKLERVHYLTVQDVLLLHELILFEGEDPGVLKPDELDGATMAVRATFGGAPLLGSLAEVAAAYVIYFNQSHVFLDGNKRTSLICAMTFLEVNGFRILKKPEDLDAWIPIARGIVDHSLSRAHVIDTFAQAMGTIEIIEWEP